MRILDYRGKVRTVTLPPPPLSNCPLGEVVVARVRFILAVYKAAYGYLEASEALRLASGVSTKSFAGYARRGYVPLGKVPHFDAAFASAMALVLPSDRP